MSQPTLFPDDAQPRELLPHGGSALYRPRVFDAAESARLLDELVATTPWKREFIRMFGRRLPMPRETAWIGDPGTTYTYSNITNEPAPWTPALLEIKRRVEPLAGVTFNSVLVNRYRDGNDSMSWHADDEAVLGDRPTIASVSFGAPRTFALKSNGPERDRVAVTLEDGSVLIMSGEMQHVWKHQVPKQPRERNGRVNLTFRVILPSRL